MAITCSKSIINLFKVNNKNYVFEPQSKILMNCTGKCEFTNTKIMWTNYKKHVEH